MIGRRDYAVLLLAARYGLRPCDLRQLRLDAVDWREGVLSITQAKTGRGLTLPLLPRLGRGRPTTTSRAGFRRGEGAALPERRPRGAEANGEGVIAAARPGHD